MKVWDPLYNERRDFRAYADGLRIFFKGIAADSFDKGYRCECKDGYKQVEVCLGDPYPNNPLCIPGCVPDCVEGMLIYSPTTMTRATHVQNHRYL